MVYLLGYNGIDTSDGGNVHDVTYRAFDVGEMNRFVQSHLNRADDFRFTHVLDELVGSVGRAQVREDQGIHFLAFQACERIFLVTQLIVQCEFDLHFAVDGQIRIFFL